MLLLAEMRKQSVIMPEECAISKVMAAAENGRRPAFLPPRSSLAVNCAGCCKKFFSQLDISASAATAKPNAWVDTMRASSPTHAKAAAALSTSAAAAAAAAAREDDYESWVTQHPSALRNFDAVVAASEGKRIVIFLDYDGTLSPIVDDPDLAVLSDAMRETVRNVARHFPTAIVSGRCREKVFGFVQLRELYYAGSHGMDIKGPSKATKHTKSKAKDVFFQPASEFLPVIEEVCKALEEKTKSIPGSRVENNIFSLSVHFRCVEEKKWSSLADRVRSVLKDYPELRLTIGRKVLEVRPSIKWDKGKALEFLLESLGYADSDSVFPIYIGDDRTDEDAFKVLQDRGQGAGILVSECTKQTNASYSLRETAEVREFLNRLVEWKRHFSKK